MLEHMNLGTSISQDHEKDLMDLIDRQEAIDALDEGLWGKDWDKALAAAIITGLPSAQPELTDEEKRLIKKLRSYHNGSYAKVIDKLLAVASAQSELTESWWKTDHGYMWLCPHCGLPVHSDFEECLRCGIKRPSAQPEKICVAKVTMTDEQVKEAFENAKMEILAVHPDLKKGKWIETVKHYKDDEQEYDYIEVNCSECGARRKIGWRDARCCPNCGVKIEGVTG